MVKDSKRTLSRDRILDVALRHLARHGYRKTSLTDIARELGVVKGALYYHLPGGKAEIIDAVVRRERQTMLAAMREASDGVASASEALRLAIRTKLLRLKELADLFEVPREIGEEIAAHATTAQQSFNAEERALYEEIVRRGEEGGEFRRIEPRSAAAAGIQAMVWALEVPEVYGANGAGPAHPGGLIEAVLDLLLNGLRKPGASSTAQ
jgi:AcrR family transcriptional regulator